MPRKQPTAPDWPVVAAAVARHLPHTALLAAPLLRARAEFMRDQKRRGRAARWAVAFSGGADSLALLLILWAEGPGRWGRDLVVLHFNHRLRGRASQADEKFCRKVCGALGVTLVTGRWDRPPPQASEAAAREARHAFFRREMRRRRIRLLWLAHQQDDVAESMLMRLARGSGAGGLSAPRPVQEFPEGRLYLRPLLALPKADLIQALRASGAVWREDATNGQPAYFRNRIRRAVLPAWSEAAGRDAVAGAALTRELLEEDETALEAWVDGLRVLKRGVLDVGALHGLPRAVQRRALHRWLLTVRPKTDLSRQGFGVLLAAVAEGKPTRFSLGSTHFAVIRDGQLRLRRSG